MKKVVIVCGLIGGTISCFWWAIGEPLVDESVSYNMRVFFGYAAMILAFSLIFVGIKSYRDQYNNGVISFGKAVQIALLITFVASTVYTVAWLINYYFFMPDFGENMMASMRADLIAKGVSQPELQKQMAEMTQFMQQYKNPFYNAMITYTEILPVGVVISLIAALILKRNPKITPLNPN